MAHLDGWRGTLDQTSAMWAEVAQNITHETQTTFWRLAGRILRYLKGTKAHGIIWKCGNHEPIHAYADANWEAPQALLR